VLYRAYPPRNSRGFTLFFTGLSGSGKTTISQALYSRLQEIEIATAGRGITTLDGDVIRTHLSKGLGFSRADRLENIRRIGFVASEISKHRGIAMAVAIAPFEEARQDARKIVTSKGGAFVEVFVNTTVEVCAQRDVKGLYAKAARGEIKLTGVNDPFEEPLQAEIVVDGADDRVGNSVDAILAWLHEAGYIATPSTGRLSKEQVGCSVSVPEHKEVGTLHQAGYKFHYTNGEEQVSAWHALPLVADAQRQIYNFVNEIPKLTRAKMELNKEEPGNPIMQDKNKDGSLRFYSYGDSRFNYGFLPQTWEDPKDCVDKGEVQWCGDNDPIDVIEVSDEPIPFGAVTPVRILGNLKLIDQGEVDHKILAVSTVSELGQELYTLDDLERLRPKLIPAIVDWLINYKTTDGKAKNVLESIVPVNATEAIKTIEETHHAWSKLIKSETQVDSFWIKNTSPVSVAEALCDVA